MKPTAFRLGLIAARCLVASRVLSLGLLAASFAAMAQSSGEQFEIIAQTLDSGGGHARGTDFAVNGTIGQPEVMPQSATGSEFQLSGGFWARNTVPPPTSDAIFLDGFESP